MTEVGKHLQCSLLCQSRQDDDSAALLNPRDCQSTMHPNERHNFFFDLYPSMTRYRHISS
ncbi:unnamed protein product [Periconia digitata]|uniref:Uncharacterized protein n=1 Tax=Periconia digitata TaxID=1303443 RepID=A0A9W4UIM6_9PLEO|nr:unnamed protein product [Periconia digitata]